MLDALGRLHPRPPVLRDELLRVLELPESDLRKRIREYSRGMKQKLGLVAALQHDPPLVILDEPTGGLDPVIQGRLLDWLAGRARAGRTVFFSSHVLSEVEELCDRVAMVRDGRLLLAGPVDELRRARSRRVEVRFAEPVDPSRYAVDGRRRRGGRRPAPPLQRRPGSRAPLLAALAALPVDDVAIAPPSLEESFRHLYGEAGRRVRTVYGLALERARVRILLLALGFGLFEFVVGLSYASVDQNAIRQVVDALPPALRALAGSADIATPTGYAGSGYLHPVALAVQAAVAISMAAAPAREAEDGTAELVLSRPLPPHRLARRPRAGDGHRPGGRRGGRLPRRPRRRPHR